MIDTGSHTDNERQKYLQQFAWSQAQTVEERLATFHNSHNSATGQPVYDRDLAERRVHKWLQQAPFDQEQYFFQRLEQDHLSVEDLLLLLGEAPAALQARSPDAPTWAKALCEAFFSTPPAPVSPDAPYAQSQASLLHVLSPLLKYFHTRLSTQIQAQTEAFTHLPFDAKTIASLFLPHLAGRFSQLITKTLALELNIARIEERLEGETPEERFRAFLCQLSNPTAMLDLFSMYPVLARRLMTIANYWENNALEVLTRLCQDWSDICQDFAPERDPGLLAGVEIGIGDTHCQGQSVIKLTFVGGFRLLYKPKSLKIDTQFSCLLDQINTWGDHPALRVARVIDKGSYGWAEFIETRECSTPEEMARFYQRLGCLLALLHTLEATDMHFENMIASGEHPILIDLESLFQPYLPLEEKVVPLPGTRVLRTSVIRTALLPHKVWQGDEADGIDVSGLGGQGGQLTPFAIPLFEETGTDQMRLIRKRVEMREQQNRPRLVGNAVDLVAYLDQLVEGFSHMYRLLLAHRQELLEQQLPLFAQTRIRVIIRPTRQYGRLLEEGTHPKLLRNALDQARFLDRLWVSVPQLPALARLIRAEQTDLRVGDIPMFWTYPDACDLYTSKDECIPDFFRESSLACSRKKLQQLSEQDLAHQIWLVKASVLTANLESGQTNWQSSQLRADAPRVEMTEPLRAACEIGDRLCEQAICAQDAISWLTLRLLGERAWDISVTGLDLYNGLSGICLFLAYLGNVTKQERYTELARLALETIRQQIKQLENPQPILGAFDGWGGFLYLYTHLAMLWQEPELLHEAQAMLAYFVDGIEQDALFDVIRGAAGCLLGLLTLYEAAPSHDVLQAAIRCGEHLLNQARPMTHGQGWVSPISGDAETALTGFSHGTAGIALSLLRLAAASGEQRFHEAALAAIAYERSLYSPVVRNWPDLRKIARQENGPGFMLAWCHGAPGIGMARLASLPYCDNPAMREEIALAIEATLAQGFGANHSLCHGDLGNLELLLSAAEILGETRYQSATEHLVAQELESIRLQGWCTGVPRSVETPGLMTGLAGIGYGLLRVAAPDRVPAILLLAAPPQVASLRKD